MDENAEHGALVKDLIDSKKAIESKSKTSKKNLVISEAEQERTKKQIEKLQADIQQISRTTAPIGRVLGTYASKVNFNFFRLYPRRYGINAKRVRLMVRGTC